MSADEIRLATNLAYTNQAIHLTNFSLTGSGGLIISGGYSDCADTTPSGTTTIDGRQSITRFKK